MSIPAITVLDGDGRIIDEEQRRVFRYNAQSGFGADIIFGAGTNGEWNRISNRERQRLIWIETAEIASINREVTAAGHRSVEAWVGVTAETRRETLENVECAIEAGADAAVIAPLSIRDIGDVVSFFQRDLSDRFDHLGKWIPIFLYDNADIAADPRIPHIKTRDVKRLSRLQFTFGVKVSASRKVLGNYTKGALHFRDKGDFGIYVGNAMLIFDLFRMEDGLLGRIKEYWNRYLLHNELPVGVVAGPANVFPREWQRAWRACFAGDDGLMQVYRSTFEQFNQASCFTGRGTSVSKLIACLKLALKIEGVIESALVATGTPSLSETEAARFRDHYLKLKDDLRSATDSTWISRRFDD